MELSSPLSRSASASLFFLRGCVRCLRHTIGDLAAGDGTHQARRPPSLPRKPSRALPGASLPGRSLLFLLGSSSPPPRRRGSGAEIHSPLDRLLRLSVGNHLIGFVLAVHFVPGDHFVALTGGGRIRIFPPFCYSRIGLLRGAM